MSNHLAIAAATQTLAQLLDEQLSRDVGGAHAKPARPDTTAGAEPEVRLFLYRVEPNASWRNNALPARSQSGLVYERPQIGLTLHYLLTFMGDEAALEPQRMLGSVVRTLNARPLLTRAEIEQMVAAAIADGTDHPLALTDLAEQPEIVRLNPLQLTLDELSTLWSSFFQTPYRLSVAYQACVVLLTSEETPTRALPVRDRRLFTTTMLRPTISRATAAGPPAAIQLGSTLIISGSQLPAEEITVVAFGGVEVTPAADKISGTRIEVTVPAGVRAGVTALRVIHRRLMGEPSAPRLAGQSAAFPIIIQPRLLSAAVVHDVDVNADTGLLSGGISVSVEPPVGSRQQVAMMLNAAAGGNGQAFVFEDERRDKEGEPEETADLDIGFGGVPSGDYLIRITVDGAETSLEVDPATGQYRGPLLAVVP